MRPTAYRRTAYGAGDRQARGRIRLHVTPATSLAHWRSCPRLPGIDLVGAQPWVHARSAVAAGACVKRSADHGEDARPQPAVTRLWRSSQPALSVLTSSPPKLCLTRER